MERKILRPLSFLLCSLVVVHVASSQQTSLPATIAEATWEDSRNEYRHSPLCAAEEVTLWTCEAGKRVYSLCSSRVVSRVSGYVQYRAAKSGKVVLVFPAQKQPPLGSFTYHSELNGDASVEFSISGYGYRLVDPLRTNSSILVRRPDAAAKTKEISCGGNQTLQVNYTMRLMHDAGVWSDR